MKKKLNGRETLFIATMLFGMFFGAGNLIFPVYMGQLAGKNVWPAFLGFLITGVGLPLMGVAAIGLSRSDGLLDLSSKVSRRYSIVFTCALYLTIGPFFAIPRCATVPFTIGITPLLGEGAHSAALPVFSAVFFLIVLGFSLRPGKILTYVGKFLTPAFLLFLGILVVTALLHPMARVADVQPTGAYLEQPFFTGFLEGYNTMDAIASLAFGIVVVNVVRGLGVEKPEHVAAETARAGIFSCIMMGVIYLAVTIAGTQSSGAGVACSNGGEVLSVISGHYFGKAGSLILAAIVTLACLKTSVGLVTSCAETFELMFPKGPKYRAWAVIFSVLSFLIANLGLDTIIAYSIPVLMLLYPPTITLILLGLLGRFFDHDRAVYCCVTAFTLPAAVIDFIGALPESATFWGMRHAVQMFCGRYLPLFSLGLGWVCPALVGLAIGLILRARRKAR